MTYREALRIWDRREQLLLFVAAGIAGPLAFLSAGALTDKPLFIKIVLTAAILSGLLWTITRSKFEWLGTQVRRSIADGTISEHGSLPADLEKRDGRAEAWWTATLATLLATWLALAAGIWYPAARAKEKPLPERVPPERIGEFPNFRLGGSTLDLEGHDSGQELAKICGRVIEQRKRGWDATLLVIGATDRLSPRRIVAQRYESNFGLAMARAETVKTELARCVPAPDRVLALVAGPRTASGDKPPREGDPADRRVDVWAIWTGAASN